MPKTMLLKIKIIKEKESFNELQKANSACALMF